MRFTKTRELKDAATLLRELIVRDYKLSDDMIAGLALRDTHLINSRTDKALISRRLLDYDTRRLTDEGKEVANVLLFAKRMGAPLAPGYTPRVYFVVKPTSTV